MDFLDQVYFDNTLKSYFIVLGIVLVVMLFRKPLSHGISSLFYLLIKRRWKSIEKREFTILTIRPLSWLLVVIVSVFALDKLTFPSALDFKIYGHSSEEITARLGITIIIVMFIWFVLSLIDFIALLLKNPGAEKVDKGHDQVVVFFRDFLKVVIGIIGALMIIKAALNQDIGSVLTGLSIVGAALALAGKE
ncbi:MAG: mechanosensitive ion channel protein MscS, partial [Chryseobacterium sp.]